MALFDFPRIHFAGNLDVDVPTINNSVYFPLTIYDQMRSKWLLPPRLYFSTEAAITRINSGFKPKIYQDQYNGLPYIEIEPIKNIPLLRTWCMTPLGTDKASPDYKYLPYYQAADAAGKHDLKPAFPLVGSAMGYWNMWGSMGVTMSDVNVTGVQTFEQGTILNYNKSSKNTPADVQRMLNASFDLYPKESKSISSACMVETISSQSSYANIFCSNVNLYNSANPDDVLLSGNPKRFAALIYSAWRVLNWFPAMAGSGRFCATVNFADVPEAETSEVVKFFKAHKAYDPRPIKGVFVTFQILEVFENRYDQSFYVKNLFKSVHNPATASTMGSITPWYEGDMETGILGRNLISLGQNSWYTNTVSIKAGPIPLACVPPIASLKELGNGTAIFSVDMGNSWPEAISPPYSENPNKPFMPTHRGQASFETMGLGDMILRYGSGSATEICRIKINPADNPKSKVAQTDCVFDFLITDKNLINNIKNNYISCYLQPLGAPEIKILQESPYMMSSDQKGIYSNEGDTDGMGYYCSDSNRVRCRLRIYQRGLPVTTPVKIFMGQYTVPEAGNDATNPEPSVTLMLKDNDIVPISTTPLKLTDNAIYYFIYEGQYPGNAFPPFTNASNNYSIMDTGAFVVLRVHPKADYSMYIDKQHPNYTPPTYEVVYNEVFKLYDVVYPVMATVIPFTEANWNAISGNVIQRTDIKNWSDITYMPRSRELSDSQRELLVAWDKAVNKSNP